MRKFGVFFGNSVILSILLGALALTVACAPTISAKSAILINADSGEVILEYNADERRGMASTTKIMTAIIAIETGKLDEKFEIPKEAIGVEGSSLYLKAGEAMTLRELVTGVMLQSANDAAAAIAIILSGSIENFSKVMNEKAAKLGLSNTHFDNPHGLASDQHYTTARELAKIAAYAVKNPVFKEICSLHTASLPGKDYPRRIVNHNKMLSMYDGAYGVKTGFTKATGRCLVSAAERDGVNLIAVTICAPDDWNDHKKLLDFGFDNYKKVVLADKGKIVASLPIIGGEIDNVSVYVKNDVLVCIEKNHGSIIERIELNRPKFAPVYQGDEVGRIVFFSSDKEIASSPLLAAEYVGARKKLKNFLEKIFS